MSKLFLVPLLLSFLFSSGASSVSARTSEDSTVPIVDDNLPKGPYCRPWNVIKKELFGGYQEVPVWGGISQRGEMAYVLFMAGDGSWTLISRRANDPVACVVAFGRSAILYEDPYSRGS